MKAVRCLKYGPPEVLQLTEVAQPIPKDNEILVKIHATTVAAGDCRMRGFNVPSSYRLIARFALGFNKPRKDILGMEIAGEVVVAGKKVKKYKIGDLVFGQTVMQHFGGYAEYICLPETTLIELKPKNLSLAESATIPIGGRTALYFLRQARIQTGQKVLIYGSSGSVGTYAVQLAKYFGAEVTGVCSTSNLKLVSSLGADQVIDYTREDFTENGESYDIIFDTVGKTAMAKTIRSIRKNGYFLHAVATPAVSFQMQWAKWTTGKNMVGGGPEKDQQELSFLKELVEQGKLRTVIDRTYTLEEIVEAHRYVDQGHKKGNVIILVDAKVDQLAEPLPLKNNAL